VINTPAPIIASLNDRQRAYLLAAYAEDQRRAAAHGGPEDPATRVWRWISACCRAAIFDGIPTQATEPSRDRLRIFVADPHIKRQHESPCHFRAMNSTERPGRPPPRHNTQNSPGTKTRAPRPRASEHGQLMLECNALPNQCSVGTAICPGSFNGVAVDNRSRTENPRASQVACCFRVAAERCVVVRCDVSTTRGLSFGLRYPRVSDHDAYQSHLEE
jgi:hypothetical protein